MDVTIKLDDEAARKVLQDGLAALSPEDINEVLKTALTKFFIENQVGKQLIYEERYGDPKPGYILNKALEKMDFTEIINNYRDKVIKELVENHDKILERAVLNMMINGLVNDWQFRDNLRDSIRRIMTEDANRCQ